MHKKIIGFSLALLALGIGAFIFNRNFEIVDYNKYFPPSREAQINNYLALQRWLVSEGYYIREDREIDADSLAGAFEKTIFLQSNLIEWDEVFIQTLDERIVNGGRIILSLNNYRNRADNEFLGEYLESLGLEFVEPGEYRYDIDRESDVPVYTRNVTFNEPENAVLVLKDQYNYPRLVEFSRGTGTITVTGIPSFMRNSNIDKEPNALISWYLFAALPGGNADGDILFIRGQQRAEGGIGRIFQRGNFLIVIIAALVLIIAGFWKAVPVFGVVRVEEKTGKALAERFLAEGLFLKRFKSLDVYRSMCEKTKIRRQNKYIKSGTNQVQDNIDILLKKLERLS